MRLLVCFSLLPIIFVVATNRSSFGEFFVLNEHPRGKRAVLVTNVPNEPCRIYGHSNPIQVIENLPEGPVLRTINQQEWLKIAAECQRRLLSLNQRPVSSGNQLDFIYPGTKWCGAGDVASHYDDLGVHAATDRCCRDHDFCQDTMRPNSCKYGLCNNSPFTKSHCDCDDKFRQCLINAANDPASIPVGFIYFDVGAISCYRQTPECANKVFREPATVTLNERRKRDYLANGSSSRDVQDGWCFVPPRPFKKPVLLQRSQPDGLLRHVITTMSDVKTIVKNAAATHLSVHTGK